MPRISICIPAYKPEHFEIALKSALSQSFKDTEVIVSDDCPTNAIETICQRYGDMVQYSRNSNPGEFNNIVRSASLASGEYIKFLFDDDVLSPFCVQFLYEALEQTRIHGTNMAFSPRYTIDSKNHITSLINNHGIENGLKLIHGPEYIRMMAMTLKNGIGEYSTVMLRAEDCLDSDGLFSIIKADDDGIFHGIPDISGFLALAKKGSFVGHPHPLSYFRVHENTQSNPTLPNFIRGIVYYEEIIKMAASGGYLQSPDLPVCYRQLFQHYSYWVPAFPELRERLEQIKMIMEKLKA